MRAGEGLPVALLYGGCSPQRDASLASGICAAAALEAGYRVAGFDLRDVDPVDIDWRQFDACFLALLGSDGEDGNLQQLLQSPGVDPPLGAALREQLESVAVAACRALGAAGLVCVDVRLGEDNRPWVLEVDATAALTENGPAPRAAAAGLSMAQFCGRLISFRLKQEAA